jgi:pimeloyl-ACP methyl ester carboxylesterase
MKSRDHLGRWRSAAAQQRFRVAEDELWREQFPQPPLAHDIETRAGTSRAYHWPGTGEPVVLLHGMGGTSLMWAEFVAHLRDHAVYAIDTMGDVGRSEHRIAFGSVDDVAEWLDETLAGLGVEHAHLVGNSYGAWMALNLAVHAPARVFSMSLLDPAGLAKVSYRFFTWGAKVFLAAFMPGPIRRRAAERLHMPLLEDKRIMRMAFMAQVNHPFRLPSAVLSDDELRGITVPTLLLIGEKSEMYTPSAVLARARATIPVLEAAIIPDVGHALPIDPKANAGQRVNEFLARLAQPHT